VEALWQFDPVEAHGVSAAWAIGETGAPRFLPFLTAWFPSSTGAERINIIQALGRIRRHEKSLADMGAIEIRSWAARVDGAVRQMALNLWSPDRPDLSSLRQSGREERWFTIMRFRRTRILR